MGKWRRLFGGQLDSSAGEHLVLTPLVGWSGKDPEVRPEGEGWESLCGARAL